MPTYLQLGSKLPLSAQGTPETFRLPTHHLNTHAVVTGMTGSGKTGLLVALVEEALRAEVPLLLVDVKGDLANLLLSFPMGTTEAFVPWVDPNDPQNENRSVQDVAASLARVRDRGLTAAGITPEHIDAFRSKTAVRVLTPGSNAGEPLHLLSSLECTSDRWEKDPESARATLSSAISLVLRLLKRDADPTSSKEHVLLSVLAERRLKAGLPADLSALMNDLETPPIEQIGALSLQRFFPKKEREKLSSALNALLSSPTFASWREGTSLDVGSWLAPTSDGRTPAVVVSVHHLDEEEKANVLGMLLDEVLAWVRSQSGTSALRALLVFDEVYGFLPPHPANPATKQPLVSLMKQARAFGVGIVLATQNPMDLDYRALSNAGLWFIGRLQTDADRERVIEGLSASFEEQAGKRKQELHASVKRLSRRWFVVRNIHDSNGPQLLQPRQTMCWLRGPLTRSELRRLRQQTVADATVPQ